MRKILYITLLAMLPLVVVAQDDTYHQLLHQYQTEYGPCKYKLLPLLGDNMLQMTHISSDTLLAVAVDAYTHQHMANDLVACLEPAFREHVSENDLQALIRWHEKHPRCQQLADIEQDMYYNPEAMMPLLAMLIEDIMEQLRQDVEAHAVDKGIDKRYQKMFNQYWEKSDIRERVYLIHEMMSEQYVNVQRDMLQQIGIDSARINHWQEHPEELVEKNCRIRVMNYMHEQQVTTADLKLLVQRDKMPALLRADEACQKAMETQDVYDYIMVHFMDWAEPLYPVTIRAVRAGYEWGKLDAMPDEEDE